VSTGKSGRSKHSSMEDGEHYSAKVVDGTAAKLDFRGVLRSPQSKKESEFASFVVERPYKFIVQGAHEMTAGRNDASPRLAVASERGPGFCCNADGVKYIDHGFSDVTCASGLLNVVGELGAEIGQHAPTCFLQPEYRIVDHKNTLVN